MPNLKLCGDNDEKGNHQEPATRNTDCSNGSFLTVRIEVANISTILIDKAANSDSKSSLCVIASKR